MLIRNKEIRSGDIITITRTVTETKTVKVVEVGTYLINIGAAENGALAGHIRNSAEAQYDSIYPEWDVVKVIHHEPKVENLSCQIGDIWLAKDGREWFIFAVYGTAKLRAMTSPHDSGESSNLPVEDFERKAVKLLHRVGNNH